MAIDIEAVLEKVDKGEALTEAEQREVMGQPHTELDVDESEDIKIEAEARDDAELAAEDADTADTSEATEKDDGEEQEAKEPDTDAGKETADDAVDAEKVKEQADKPDGKEDVSGLNERERGLFYDLRHEREKRQAAESERDTLKFRELKRQQETEAEEEPEDDDFLNKKQVEKRVNNAMSAIQQQHQAQMTALWIREGVREHPDLHQVVDLGEQLIAANPSHQEKIAEAYRAGDNPALVTYDLIKNDPGFAAILEKSGITPKEEPKEEVKKPKPEAVKNAEKLKENAEKTRVTGNTGGGEDTKSGELTIDYIRSLSDAEFKALPFAKRQQILQKIG